VEPFHCPLSAVRVDASSGRPENPGSVAFDGGIPNSTCVRSSPLNRSRSTQPETPGTLPHDVYCQKVQPSPPQLPPGTRGLGASVQWGTQSSLNPASANSGVSPMYLPQK
jgi:hypothetical protein